MSATQAKSITHKGLQNLSGVCNTEQLRQGSQLIALAHSWVAKHDHKRTEKKKSAATELQNRQRIELAIRLGLDPEAEDLDLRIKLALQERTAESAALGEDVDETEDLMEMSRRLLNRDMLGETSTSVSDLLGYEFTLPEGRDSFRASPLKAYGGLANDVLTNSEKGALTRQHDEAHALLDRIRNAGSARALEDATSGGLMHMISVETVFNDSGGGSASDNNHLTGQARVNRDMTDLDRDDFVALTAPRRARLHQQRLWRPHQSTEDDESTASNKSGSLTEGRSMDFVLGSTSMTDSCASPPAQYNTTLAALPSSTEFTAPPALVAPRKVPPPPAKEEESDLGAAVIDVLDVCHPSPGAERSLGVFGEISAEVSVAPIQPSNYFAPSAPKAQRLPSAPHRRFSSAKARILAPKMDYQQQQQHSTNRTGNRQKVETSHSPANPLALSPSVPNNDSPRQFGSMMRSPADASKSGSPMITSPRSRRGGWRSLYSPRSHFTNRTVEDRKMYLQAMNAVMLRAVASTEAERRLSESCGSNAGMEEPRGMLAMQFDNIYIPRYDVLHSWDDMKECRYADLPDDLRLVMLRDSSLNSVAQSNAAEDPRTKQRRGRPTTSGTRSVFKVSKQPADRPRQEAHDKKGDVAPKKKKLTSQGPSVFECNGQIAVFASVSKDTGLPPIVGNHVALDDRVEALYAKIGRSDAHGREKVTDMDDIDDLLNDLRNGSTM